MMINDSCYMTPTTPTPQRLTDRWTVFCKPEKALRSLTFQMKNILKRTRYVENLNVMAINAL